MLPVVVATTGFNYWNQNYGPGKKGSPNSAHFREAVESGAVNKGAIRGVERGGFSPTTEYARQKEFAQNSIQWKVRDALAAGIHPSIAIGGVGSSYQPSSYVGGGDSSSFDATQSLLEGGVDIARAFAAKASEQEKAMMALQLESAQLDNEIKRTQLRQLNMPGPSGPGANFLPGQGNSGPLVVDKPTERNAQQPGRPAQEAGWRPDLSFSRTDTGLVPMVPQGLSESMEDDFIGKAMWRWRNQLINNVDSADFTPPPKEMLPKGMDYWEWNKWKQEWQPRYYEKGTIYKRGGYYRGK